MDDFITVLKSIGPKLTKSFDGDNVIPYGQAKHFSIETTPVSNIADLAMNLRYLAPKPLRCIIRGSFKGDAVAQVVAPPARPGQYLRVGELFDEVPHHWWCADHDDFMPVLWDPVQNPEESIRELIKTLYPPEFHTASYHWQLSASAGRTPGLLKVHIWWWLVTPYTGPQVEAWVRAQKLKTDLVTLRKIQVHYVANPIFLNGTPDPMAGKRCGLHQGETEAVALDIPQDVLDMAGVRTGVTGGDLELADPTTKPGSIGAFCKAYPISRVIAEILPDLFAYADGSDRRVTWFGGGGAPEGCFVTDDDWYLGNSHNTDPARGRLSNAWDVVRLYKFGHLDAEDDLDNPLINVNELPSHRAMVAWVAELPEIKGAAAVAAQSDRDKFLADIRGAANEQTLRETILPEVAAAGLPKTDRDVLVAALLQRMREFTGVRNLSVTVARGMLRDAGRTDVDRTERPFWAAPIVYVTNGDHFFNLDTKEEMTKQGFDFSYNRFMLPFMNEDGMIPAASRYSCDVWHVPTVSNTAYNPTLDRTFEMSGKLFANTYSGANIPDVPPVLTDAEAAAVALVEAHAGLILPDLRERTLFLDFLAHNVQFPGKKIRWAVFMHGAPGAGKTFFYRLLAATMGPDNVRPLNADTLLNSNFNEWANGSAVVGIEEIKVPKTSPREADNKLKAPIANDDIDIHPKGKKGYPVVNVTNYIIFSNFPDGLPMTDDDRRYMALRAAIPAADAKAMAEAGYFVRLFDTLESSAGALRKWLLDRELSAEFSANGHAPWTSEKGRVVELSKSETQTAIEELIAEGGLGITSQVISSAHLSQAVKDKTGEKVWTNQVQRRLEEAGFTKYGRVKWSGDMRTLYVKPELVASLSEDKQEANAKLRAFLDLSLDTTDFLL